MFSPFHAGVAQLVEHHLAKVDVESSSLFARSISIRPSEATPGVFLRLIMTVEEFASADVVGESTARADQRRKVACI